MEHLGTVNLGPYRSILAIRDVRRVLMLGTLIRIPMWGAAVALTLHVVVSLDRNYAEAGLVTACATVAAAISGPWRGRLLDRVGLRRTVLPSIIVQVVGWSIGPFLGYTGLIVVAIGTGLFVVPTFSVLRQVLISAVPDDQRRTALSLDSAMTELTFMIGPVIGVWAATVYSPKWTVMVLQLLSAAAAFVLWVANPPLREPPRATEPELVPQGSGPSPAVALPPLDRDREVDRGIALAVSAEAGSGLGAAALDAPPQPLGVGRTGTRQWFGLAVIAVLVAASTSTIILSGTDVSIVAALRDQDRAGDIGWVLGLWGSGSLVGGLVYGAWHRSISVFWLLAGLAATTIPVAFAANMTSLVILLVLSGVFCAPTITATVDHLSRLVPEHARGEVMGWHGSAMTVGSALGAPIAGAAIDAAGWHWGFGVAGGVGLVVAVLGGLAMRVRRVSR